MSSHPFAWDSSLVLQGEDVISESAAADNGRFAKSVVWSPDGSQLLSTTEDNRLLVHQVNGALLEECRYYSASAAAASLRRPEMLKSPEVVLLQGLNVNAGSPVYGSQWYPGMNALCPETCCFLTTCKDRPIQLWSALTGQVQCSYVAKNHLDELDACTALSFNLQGSRIYAATKSAIRIFDVESPGATSSSQRRSKGGMVSALAFNPDYSGAYAVGTYARAITICVEGDEPPALELQALDFDVTCVRWSPDGVCLWAGGRHCDDVVCWDLRHTRGELGRVQRRLSSNQRMAFDLDAWGAHLVTGTQDGRVLVYDTTTFALVATHAPVASDCTNGVSMHPFSALLAVSSGQRHFGLHKENQGGNDDDDDDDDDGEGDLESIIATAAEKMAASSRISVFGMPFTQRVIESSQEHTPNEVVRCVH